MSTHDLVVFAGGVSAGFIGAVVGCVLIVLSVNRSVGPRW